MGVPWGINERKGQEEGWNMIHNVGRGGDEEKMGENMEKKKKGREKKGIENDLRKVKTTTHIVSSKLSL